MTPCVLEPGDVVQLKPDMKDPWGGKLLIVTEAKSFGCMGYVDTFEGQAYYRPKFEDMEYVGKCHWIFKYDEDEG